MILHATYNSLVLIFAVDFFQIDVLQILL
jgi:hypothetical protein